MNKLKAITEVAKMVQSPTSKIKIEDKELDLGKSVLAKDILSFIDKYLIPLEKRIDKLTPMQEAFDEKRHKAFKELQEQFSDYEEMVNNAIEVVTVQGYLLASLSVIVKDIEDHGVYNKDGEVPVRLMKFQQEALNRTYKRIKVLNDYYKNKVKERVSK